MDSCMIQQLVFLLSFGAVILLVSLYMFVHLYVHQNTPVLNFHLNLMLSSSIQFLMQTVLSTVGERGGGGGGGERTYTTQLYVKLFIVKICYL